MTEAQRHRLRQIKTFKQLIPFLVEELNWPIDEDLAHEDITFEWTPDELNLTDEAKVGIGSITQLRPLEGEQPWGIFFVEFEKKKLPIVILRRILNALVVKKRDSANKAERAAWQPQDLLFISAFGEEGAERQYPSLTSANRRRTRNPPCGFSAGTKTIPI